jgi:hypothetical protein
VGAWLGLFATGTQEPEAGRPRLLGSVGDRWFSGFGPSIDGPWLF